MPKILRQDEVEAILLSLGMTPRQCRVGAAIAMCEAPWGKDEDGTARANFSAIGDQALANDTWGYSYGGFQIRSLRSQKGTGEFRDEDELLRPRFNCRSAKKIHDDSGWKAWSTFVSGQYKAYLQDLFPPPPNTYVVLAGDTIITIADDISGGAWTYQELAAAQEPPLEYPYTIFVGQHLTLP